MAKLTAPQVTFDREEAGLEANAINELVTWISEAQYVLYEVRSAAQISPVLTELLRAALIPIQSPQWDDEAQLALATLLRRQAVLIASLAEDKA